VRRLNRSRKSFGHQGTVLHGAFSISESFSGVRGQRAGTQTKSDSLGSVPSTMASFTEKCRTVFGHVGGVQKLIAHGAFEAKFMKFVAASYHFFGGVN